MAAGFHAAVASLIAETAERLGRSSGIERVALSGGVFQNVLLVRLARARLERLGMEVLTHRLVPPNDGGLALGQAVITASRHQAPANAEASSSCAEDVCVTCSDEGLVAEVKAVHNGGLAEVLIGGRAQTIDTSLVDAVPGDLVLVHAGVAITNLGGAS